MNWAGVFVLNDIYVRWNWNMQRNTKSKKGTENIVHNKSIQATHKLKRVKMIFVSANWNVLLRRLAANSIARSENDWRKLISFSVRKRTRKRISCNCMENKWLKMWEEEKRRNGNVGKCVRIHSCTSNQKRYESKYFIHAHTSQIQNWREVENKTLNRHWRLQKFVCTEQNHNFGRWICFGRPSEMRVHFFQFFSWATCRAHSTHIEVKFTFLSFQKQMIGRAKGKERISVECFCCFYFVSFLLRTVEAWIESNVAYMTSMRRAEETTVVRCRMPSMQTLWCYLMSASSVDSATDAAHSVVSMMA